MGKLIKNFFLILIFFILHSCTFNYDDDAEFELSKSVIYKDKFIILQKESYEIDSNYNVILKGISGNQVLLDEAFYMIKSKDSSLQIDYFIVRCPTDNLIVYGSPELKEEDEPSGIVSIITSFGILIVIFALLFFFGQRLANIRNFLSGSLINSWLVAKMNGLELSFLDLWKLYRRKANIKLVIDTMITAHNSGVSLDATKLREIFLSGLDLKSMIEIYVLSRNAGLTAVTLDHLKTHQLAGGNPKKVVEALIMAMRSDMETTNEEIKLNLDFSTAASIDLAGEDVVEEVRKSTNYKVEATGLVKGISKDGVEMSIEAKITLLSKINAVLSQAGKVTVMARITKQIISEIGRRNYKDIIAEPFRITESVHSYVDTFEDAAVNVISIDTSDIKIGENVYAKILEENAKAEKLQREASEQKMKTREQEMKARLQEMRAKVEDANSKLIEAEIDVRKAIAKAFIDGNLDIRTFNKIENIKADTMMRKNISRIQVSEIVPPIQEEENEEE